MVRNPNEQLKFGAFELDIWTRRLYVGEKWTRLSDVEIVMFRAIAESGEEGISKTQIETALNEYRGYKIGAESNLVAVHMYRLRNLIKTITPDGSMGIPYQQLSEVPTSQRKYYLLQPMMPVASAA